MDLAIYDKNDSIFNLSCNYRLQTPGVTLAKKLKPYFQRDGGYVTGDRSAGAPVMTLNYDATSTDDAGFFETRDLQVFLLSGNDPYYLRMTPTAGPVLRFLIDTKKFGNKNDEGMEWRHSRRTITLWALSAWPETEALTIVGPTTLLDKEYIDVQNDGDSICWPYLTITAKDNILDFTLENQEARKQFKIQDQSFTTGSRYEMDFLLGPIFLFSAGGTSGIYRGNTMTAGNPFELRRGSNRIIFYSTYGAIDLQVSYRQVYLI